MSNSSSSAPSTPRSDGNQLEQEPTPSKAKAKRKTAESVPGPSGHDVLLFLIASRILNALIVQTFFQPDEYFQSLEPAWNFAFGNGSGAWITWEWKNHLRSAIHPAIFALCYRLAHDVSNLFNLGSSLRAEVLLAAPKTVQAFIAALGDYYTWRLAGDVYGSRSISAGAILILTVASPWQWFCSTRTFSNCLESTLTIIALYNWPWHWSVASDEQDHSQLDAQGLRIRKAERPSLSSVDETTRLRRALLCAALATVLRPTNILIWMLLTLLTFLRSAKTQWLVKLPGTEVSALVHFDAWSLLPNRAESVVFIREAVLCGCAVLGLSAVADRIFYETWTFPPLNFFYFNVVQSLAIFYGNNDWHYYLSQGYPLLLTTALPFALVGLYQAMTVSKGHLSLSLKSRKLVRDLAIICIFVPSVLSIISHKEVRFIYPLLPALHILAAQPISAFFAPALQHSTTASNTSRQAKRLLLLALLSLNFLISLYTTTVHNSGLIDITHYLRHQFETHYLPTRLTSPHNPGGSTNMTVGFLMPCHSTPWRSHFQYAPTISHTGINAWALTCEPPLHLTPAEKAAYLDEADQFYAEPSTWLKKHMSRHPPDVVSKHAPGVFAPTQPRARRMFAVETHLEEDLWRERKGRRPWPEYLVFFAQLEPQLTSAMRGSGYTECNRIWNSHWHDDWRRHGDVVVWCLYPEWRLVEGKKGDAGLFSWNQLKRWVGTATGPNTQEVEDGLHAPLDGTGGQKVLGARSASKVPTVPGPAERVVEKPFWKQRPPRSSPSLPPENGKQSSWWEKIPGLGEHETEKRREDVWN